MNTATAASIAADIIDYRAEYIEDRKDVAWYVAEQDGLSEQMADLVTAIVIEKMGL